MHDPRTCFLCEIGYHKDIHEIKVAAVKVGKWIAVALVFLAAFYFSTLSQSIFVPLDRALP